MLSRVPQLAGILCVVLAVVIRAPVWSVNAPVGVQAILAFDRLPYLWDGVTQQGFSSHDPTGANTDRGSYLRTEGSEYVIADVEGPGCVSRIWCTGQDDAMHHIKVYLDGETVARFDSTMGAFFCGRIAPTWAPLAGDRYISSGGYFSYLPIPFRQRCKITTTAPYNYYNVACLRYADADGLTTWTGQEAISGARQMWYLVGQDPKTTKDTRTYTGSAAIPSTGSSVTLADIPGPGVINKLYLRIPQVVPNDAWSDGILRYIRLRIYWDGSSTPAVDAPIGDFFGCGIGEYDFRSLPVGMSAAQDGWYYCYFPMPFASRALVRIYNSGIVASATVNCDIRVGDMPAAPDLLATDQIGRFYATGRGERPTTAGLDYLVLSKSGRGVYVGTGLTTEGGLDRGHLEGDERVYIDGSLTPQIYGTGTEDYFNGGWYFDYGPFALASHGNPAHERDIGASKDYQACYRFHLADPIPFSTGIKFGIEHGGQNDVQASYNSVAYYYLSPNSGLTQTDQLDVGNTTSETAHGYVNSGQTWSGSRTLQYEGDDDGVSISDDGRAHTGWSQFNVAINPENAGVRLRRRLDYQSADQKALVFVDGVATGIWFDAGSNSSKRWRDSDLEIPAPFTRGKSNILLRLEYLGGSSGFTEFRYWVFSRSPRVTSAPGQPIGDAYVRGGSYSSTNYGTAAELQVRGSSGSLDNARAAYLKFDAGELREIAGARLRMYLSARDGSAANAIAVYGVPDTSWRELNLTWANAPSLDQSSGLPTGGAIKLDETTVSAAGNWYEWDVTAYAQSELLAGRRLLTFVLADPDGTGDLLSFSSRQVREAAPSLEILSPAPSADTYIRDGDFANANYGECAGLEVKKSAAEGETRIAFLKFDLPRLSGVSSARLKLYLSQRDGSLARAISAYGMPDATWLELGQTWNWSPSLDGATLLGHCQVGAAGAWYSWDVTSYVASAAAAGSRAVALAVADAGQCEERFVFGSRESVAAPRLEINNGPEVTIAQVKEMPDGASVYLWGLPCTSGTGDLAGRIYVEEPDRSAGIAVVYGGWTVPVIQRGDIVAVRGALTTVDGERAVGGNVSVWVIQSGGSGQ